jgi:hypothetical protein
MEELYDGVVGLVEANSFEVMCLWEKYHKQNGYSWDENKCGVFIRVGSFHDMPINIEIRCICDVEFWDLVQIERLSADETENFPNSKLSTNAINFHNVLR